MGQNAVNVIFTLLDGFLVSFISALLAKSFRCEWFPSTCPATVVLNPLGSPATYCFASFLEMLFALTLSGNRFFWAILTFSIFFLFLVTQPLQFFFVLPFLGGHSSMAKLSVLLLVTTLVDGFDLFRVILTPFGMDFIDALLATSISRPTE
jgi:hypothetical protein